MKKLVEVVVFWSFYTFIVFKADKSKTMGVYHMKGMGMC